MIATIKDWIENYNNTIVLRELELAIEKERLGMIVWDDQPVVEYDEIIVEE